MKKSLLLGVLYTCIHLLSSSISHAETPADEMCGDGSTFDVVLGSETLNVPNGCRIYALIVSGYERNSNLDELTFYNLAKFVAENDGYVHYAWWNNLLKEYMAGPLHDSNSNPGGLLGVHAAGFVPLDGNFFNKAIPNEDFRFQHDADSLLQEIRRNNPNAIVIVAGHSMGGNAVARLGATTNVSIDLLAPIDPVGNRSLPEGLFSPLQLRPGAETYNWTRWRATHRFRGYRVWDCVRNARGRCQDFDPRIFFVQYRCGPSGPWLDHPPSAFSKAPIICPRGTDVFSGPVRDTGTLVRFGSNVRRLYHRWQKESAFPFDFGEDYYFGHPSPLSSSILGPNYQAPLGKNALLELDPAKTCGTPLKADPRDPNIHCNPSDGHGEIIGFRGVPVDPGFPVALKATDWPGLDVGGTAEARRDKFIEMTTAPAADPSKLITDLSAWTHEPSNPNLDMVARDLIAITNDLLLAVGPGPDTTAATSTAGTFPDANTDGWHNDNVLVTLSASDNAGGSGVMGIEYQLEGAQVDSAVVQGDEFQLTITGEGVSLLSFFAHDNSGNIEDTNTLTIRLDKTPPNITAVTDPEANSNGWHKDDVLISFSATDDLSGVASTSLPFLVTQEGVDQQIIGTAMDLAGNSASLGVIVNMDKTVPEIIGLPDNDCTLWPVNGEMVHVASMAAEDMLSGLDSLSLQGASNEADNQDDSIVIENGEVFLRAERSGSGVGRIYSITATARDLAGNTTETTGTCVVPHDQRKRTRKP